MAVRFPPDNRKAEFAPPLPKILPFVEVRLMVAAVIVAVLLAWVIELAALRVNVVPAEDGPWIVTAPVDVSLMFALVAAFAVKLAMFVLKALATDVPPIPPAVEVKTRLVAFTVPVMLLLSRSFFEARVTVPTGVVELPIAAPTVNVPFCALRATVEFALVFPASIVAVVFRVVAFVATKLKALSADDAPFMVTVPVAESETNALPLAALALTLAAEAANGDATLVPMFPFIEVRLRV